MYDSFSVLTRNSFMRFSISTDKIVVENGRRDEILRKYDNKTDTNCSDFCMHVSRVRVNLWMISMLFLFPLHHSILKYVFYFAFLTHNFAITDKWYRTCVEKVFHQNTCLGNNFFKIHISGGAAVFGRNF